METERAASAAEIFPEVYEELRRLAQSYLGARGPATLQPTVLVHEAYMRIAAGSELAPKWRDRQHFCAIAALAMRHVLIDYCRQRVAEKRGGGAERVTLSGLAGSGGEDAVVDVLALDETLVRLAQLDERMARIVELRIFGGMTGDEIAAELEVSRRTVESDWRRARAWLSSELGAGWRYD